MTSRPATVIDLFAGAGGLSLGFAAAGCRILAAVDVDELAARTFTENFRKLQPEDPPTVLGGDEGDLEDLDLERVHEGPAPDFLIGGPPCQGFSRIGRAKLDSLYEEGFAEDPRNELYRRFLEAAEFWRPTVVLMENVPGMLSVAGRNVADDAAADLAGIGYSVGYGLLNAVWYGVPQFRERLFFVGIRSDLGLEPCLPDATHFAELPSGYSRPVGAWTLPLPFVAHRELHVKLDSASRPATTAREALEDLPEITDHLASQTHASRRDFRRMAEYRSSARSPFARLMRGWPSLDTATTIHDHVIRRTPRDYETFKRMLPGDRYPQALSIARQRFHEELARLHHLGVAPQTDSPAYRELERRFVPPYPLDVFVDKWRKLLPDQPSWTIPAHLSKDAYSHIHYDSAQARAISVREAARLQSFPDTYSFAGCMGDCFRQVGNAVPPLLSWAVATKLLDLVGLAGRPTPLEGADAGWNALRLAARR